MSATDILARLSSATRVIEFTVPGVPVPKGSTRSFVVRGPSGPRTATTNANPKTRGWETSIAEVAAEMWDGEPLLAGPVVVVAEFVLPRPMGHFGARGLKPSAPTWPTHKPDIDKLLRCALDALTGQVLSDDARVVAVIMDKTFADDERRQGLRLQVWALDGK